MAEPPRSNENPTLPSEDVLEELDLIARQLRTKGVVTLRDLEAAKHQKKSSQP
jgi:hypothetical protein